jgi:hypothetical protein
MITKSGVEMARKWVQTRTSVETLNASGESVVLEVNALMDEKTGKLRIRPYELAQAEIKHIAEQYDLEPRDVMTLMVIFAKPGHYKEGEVFFKYHLQKMLFYLWKELGNNGYYEAMPRDEFIAADNGPKPQHINEDLTRLVEKNLIEMQEEYWNSEAERPSKRILLTDEGLQLSKALWFDIPEPYRVIAIKVKERIHPMDPTKVRRIVHREYPEYEDTYVENDIE